MSKFIPIGRLSPVHLAIGVLIAIPITGLKGREQVAHAETAFVAPAEVVDAFHHALATGALPEVQSLLDPAVLVFESGGIERSASEYAAHHLAADAAFLSGARVILISRRGDSTGDLAWLASESRISVEGAEPRELVSTETMVLRRSAEGWRIVHVHWSSRPATAE